MLAINTIEPSAQSEDGGTRLPLPPARAPQCVNNWRARWRSHNPDSPLLAGRLRSPSRFRLVSGNCSLSATFAGSSRAKRVQMPLRWPRGGGMTRTACALLGALYTRNETRSLWPRSSSGSHHQSDMHSLLLTFPIFTIEKRAQSQPVSSPTE